MSETIQIRRATSATDEYGDPIPGTFTNHVALVGKFAPNNPAEPVEVGRNAVITGGTVYVRDLATPPDVKPTDRARIRGVDYDIDGEIDVWRRSASWGIQFAVTATKEAR